MKKICSLVLALALMATLALAFTASAAGSVTFRLVPSKSTVRAGDVITVAINVSGAKAANGIAAADATLTFNAALFDIQKPGNTYATAGSKMSPGSLRENLSGSSLLLTYTDADGGAGALMEDTTFATVSFKAKSGIPPDTKASFGLTVSKDSLGDKDNQGGFTVTTSGTTVTFTAAPSNNANLKTLSASNAKLSPAFSPNTTQYTASVPFSVSKLSLQYAAEDNDATGVITNPTLKAGGKTNVTLKVTAADGKTTKTYTIVVTRAADPNATTREPTTGSSTEPTTVPNDIPTFDAGASELKSLAVKDFVLSPVFNPGQTHYVVWLPYEYDAVEIIAVAADSNAEVIISGGENLIAGAKNPASILVRAPDGAQNVYQIDLRRAPNHGAEDLTQPPSISIVTSEVFVEGPETGIKPWILIVGAVLGLGAGAVGGVLLAPMMKKNKRF